MEEKKILNEEEIDAVSGGLNTSNWQGAHWQPTNIPMGTTFVQNGFLWYRIKSGDTLSKIALTFGTNMNTLKANNPATIKNINAIYAGDAIIIRRA